MALPVATCEFSVGEVWRRNVTSRSPDSQATFASCGSGVTTAVASTVRVDSLRLVLLKLRLRAYFKIQPTNNFSECKIRLSYIR